MNAQIADSPAVTPRFIKIGEDGALLPRDAPHWVAVLDTKANLMRDVKARRVPNQSAALELVKTLSIAGFTDWRAPTAEEEFLLADRTRVNPAIDTEFFPDTPSDWFWTSTPLASSPSVCAWGVAFYDGYSYWSDRDFQGFVRAVRPGQIIGILG